MCVRRVQTKTRATATESQGVTRGNCLLHINTHTHYTNKLHYTQNTHTHIYTQHIHIHIHTYTYIHTYIQHTYI